MTDALALHKHTLSVLSNNYINVKCRVIKNLKISSWLRLVPLSCHFYYLVLNWQFYFSTVPTGDKQRSVQQMWGSWVLKVSVTYGCCGCHGGVMSSEWGPSIDNSGGAGGRGGGEQGLPMDASSDIGGAGKRWPPTEAGSSFSGGQFQGATHASSMCCLCFKAIAAANIAQNQVSSFSGIYLFKLVFIYQTFNLNKPLCISDNLRCTWLHPGMKSCFGLCI